MVKKYLLPLFVLVYLLIGLIESVNAHEFDSLGVLIRHKENKLSLIAAPALTSLAINATADKLNFDSNNDGITTFQEVLALKEEIVIQVERLVIFRDEQGRIATLKSVRLVERGYEDLLKMSHADNSKVTQKQNSGASTDPGSYIQLLLKFEWQNKPQAIDMHYGLLSREHTQVLIRDQNNRSVQMLNLQQSAPDLRVFPIVPDDKNTNNAIWLLGIEHVLVGLDHLLYILALVLLCKKLSRLIVPLSTFTLSHSLALALLAFGVEVNIASEFIEAGIAMTIVIMALLELSGWQPKRLFILTAIMGFIHGLGLGQALTNSIGDVEGWAIALVQITLGIELAQLAVALFFLAMIIYLPKLIKVSRLKLSRLISYMIVLVAIFWTIERMLNTSIGI